MHADKYSTCIRDICGHNEYVSAGRDLDYRVKSMLKSMLLKKEFLAWLPIDNIISMSWLPFYSLIGAIMN